MAYEFLLDEGSDDVESEREVTAEVPPAKVVPEADDVGREHFPPAVPPPSDVPASLCKVPRWVCWKYEERDGKKTTVPYSAVTGARASSTDSETWSSLECVLGACEADASYAGVGFVLGGGYGGVDLDGSVDEAGRIKPWAQAILTHLDSYAEFSPSGRSIKVFLLGAAEQAGRRGKVEDGQVEAYSTGRYFTVTGMHVEGTPCDLQPRGDELESLLESLFKPETGHKETQPSTASSQDVPHLPDDELLGLMFGSKSGEAIKKLWAGDATGYPSESEADAALLAHLCWWTNHDARQMERLFSRSELGKRDKWTERPDYRERSIRNALETTQGGYEPPESAITRLLKLMKPLEYIHALGGDLFARIDGKRPMLISERGGDFRHWLQARYLEAYGRPAPSQVLSGAVDAVLALASEARPLRRLHRRVAEHDGNVYLDLGGDVPRAVEVTPDGWRIVEDLPVDYRYSRATTGVLPDPDPDGTVQDLAKLMDLLALREDDAYLTVCWLLGALMPDLPHPILLLTGPQGAGKSTIARLLASVVDPVPGGGAAGRPREERDLSARINWQHVIVLDNLTSMPEWLSDSLSRSATGEGSLDRRLYTNDDLHMVHGYPAYVLTGITIRGMGADLIDRCLSVALYTLPASSRRAERDLQAEFERLRLRALAGLLDCVVVALRNRSTVPGCNLPRMADFAQWILAAEEELHKVDRFRDKDFLELYGANRRQASVDLLEGDPVADALRTLLDNYGGNQWSGTTGELHAGLSVHAPLDLRHQRDWPQSAQALGRHLKRLAPDFRATGLKMTYRHSMTGTIWTIESGTAMTDDDTCMTDNPLSVMDLSWNCHAESAFTAFEDRK